MNVLFRLCLASVLLVGAVSANAGSGDVTFIHIGDLHGHLIPHADFREGDAPGQMVGGLAYVYDEIQKIRKRRPGALLINTGDTIHGSAEALFSSGEAMVEVLRPFSIDAFVPGNWDYLYGPVSFRRMFAGATPEANWHGLAANLYYSTLYEYPATPYAKLAGQRVLPPYLVRVVNGVRVGLVGLTADRGPQAVSTRVTDGFTLTSGEFELRAAIPILRNKYKVDLVVLLSERGLGPNLELADTIPGIDVVLSSDMHEESHHVLVGKNGTLLVEEGQDGTQVGELTVRVAGGKMRSHSFIAHRISTRNNRPDPGIAALIEKVRAPFVKGAAFRAHSNPINGAVLRTPIDTIVGYTETPLQRANFAGSKGDNAVIEGSSHDFLADAFRASCNADLGIIRGFRYGTQVAGSVAAPGPIRLEDLYHYIPIGPQIACGKVSGDDIRLMVERDAASSLSSWVDSWGGGWLTAFSGLSYDLDPANEAGWRVTNLRVGNAPIDLEKYYSIGGYWYVDNPDRINRAPMLDIRVLRDSNGDVLDATDIVAHYLLSLPDHTVRVDGGRVHLVQPLPKPIGLDREIQPLRGAPRPDY